MKVVLADTAKTQLALLTKTQQLRVVKKLVYLEKVGLRGLLRMKNSPLYRLRVGDYRVIGIAGQKIFTILYIGHRSKVYKDFD